MRKPIKRTAKKKGPNKKAPEAKKEDFEWLLNPITGVRDPNMGIEYDFNKINKLYKSLNCPDDVYNPTHLPYDKCKYFMLLSSRSVGKTTNILLWGMCANKIYGTQIMYIRQREAMIERRYLDNTVGLLSVIRAFGYVEKITEGRWHDVEYYARAWRYVNRDAEGKITEKCPDAFMVCVDIDQAETYKSTLNAPRGDILVFDEFISHDYKENEFCIFCDLVKTIIRDRMSPIIFMLANNTSVYNQYIYEMEAKMHVAALAEGDNCIYQTSKGTMVYCEYIGTKNKVRPIINSQFFGFSNQGLAAITGGGWVITPYPHIWKDETREILQKYIYLKYQEQYIELEICTNADVGVHVCAHRTRKITDPIVIYTIGEIRQPREVYAFGNRRPIDKLIWGLFEQNLWYFADDDVGAIVSNYHAQAK